MKKTLIEVWSSDECEKCENRHINKKICGNCIHALDIPYEELMECELTKKDIDYNDTCKYFRRY